MLRMWINQPSINQPFHMYHGQCVLAERSTAGIVRVWFTHGDLISMNVHKEALSHGWKR